MQFVKNTGRPQEAIFGYCSTNNKLKMKIEIIGFLGNDAEIKEFNGKRYISFNVAASDRHKDANGTVVSRTTWISCLKLGEGTLATYLKKGTQVFIRGDLSTKIFTNANGAQVGINCHVRELQLLSGGSKTQTDEPASAQQPTATAQPAQPPYGATAAPVSEKNDDLPF